MEFIQNGQAHGDVASTLLHNGFDTHALRPWIGKDGRTYIARNEGGKLISVPTQNATATLRKNEWIDLDAAILIAAKERLKIVADLRGRGLVYNIPNGMGKTVLESQSQSDITGAMISMDPSRESEGDRPEFDLVGLPLPVIHKDFSFNARQVATSRNMGAGIDVTTAQLAARRVAEEAEKLTLGVLPKFSYGGGAVYGLTNFPSRVTTISLTDPTSSGWTPALLVQELLAMRQASILAHHYGPWALYTSPAWDQYLDEDYSPLKGDSTVRQRLAVINGIEQITTLDYLTGMQMVLVQMTSDVIRMVIGMDITTLQWESQGGMRLNFKVMAIMVPQLRADFNGQTGIVHGVAA